MRLSNVDTTRRAGSLGDGPSNGRAQAHANNIRLVAQSVCVCTLARIGPRLRDCGRDDNPAPIQVKSPAYNHRSWPRAIIIRVSPFNRVVTEIAVSRRLSDKVCIITGTGGSVGRAAALAFAHENASVVGCDINVAAAETTAEKAIPSLLPP